VILGIGYRIFTIWLGGDSEIEGSPEAAAA